MVSMQVDTPKVKIPELLTALTENSPPSLHRYYDSFRNLYNRKLWHQLNDSIFAYYHEPDSRPYRLELFNSFIRDFESKLNPLRLVDLVIIVAREFDNPQTHVTFLTELLERIKEPQANALLLATVAHAKLLYGDLEESKKDIDKCAKALEDLPSVEKSVNAAYYSAAADYYRMKPEYAPYYRNALLYLACLPDLDSTPPPLSPEEKLVRAHDLAMAAFLGEEIYNFGELLMHPILDCLDNTPHDWLKKLLYTFNEGDIGKFDALVPLFSKEPLLVDNHSFLRQKVCMMALIESAFRRMRSSTSSRTLTFQTIAEETRLPVDDVEHLVMKALSLNLIRGTIDEVSQTASITWVQPRVLSRAQIGLLANRLTEWCEKLSQVEKYVSGQSPELFVNA
ncbi:hypothetical protein SISSUDRAFT_1048854 [Sistotremastrum suecicum HHB10207 ss-3]|uniref:PCI domain-containing protein n=1 Tax=Sistotremastrum suecicum HHB10207 ss-3 TaxID=1314776 RepID=A0A166C8L1_9AGAM|nr:hypothetical protein SISSUDRAFT_1048854 [Sistotremastrum suecicum HHB10207 ss-3]